MQEDRSAGGCDGARVRHRILLGAASPYRLLVPSFFFYPCLVPLVRPRELFPHFARDRWTPFPSSARSARHDIDHGGVTRDLL